MTCQSLDFILKNLALTESACYLHNTIKILSQEDKSNHFNWLVHRIGGWK